MRPCRCARTRTRSFRGAGWRSWSFLIALGMGRDTARRSSCRGTTTALRVPFPDRRDLRPELSGAVGDDTAAEPVEDDEDEHGSSEHAAEEFQHHGDIATLT